jgi:L-fuconolactonase
MPICPIVDTHVHLWHPHKLRLRWIDESELLNQRYDIDVYKQHTSGQGVNFELEAMVYAEVGAEPHYTLLEVISVEDRARLDPRLKGIIAHAPCEDGAPLRTYLSALKSLSPRVRGVRRLLQGESEPGFCLRPDFVAGVQMLPEFGLSFDICIRHQQLPDAIELARRCPQVTFVLDHIAKPDIAAGLREPWKAHITQLAALPNVNCKISGMLTEAAPDRSAARDVQFYFDHIVEQFGDHRVMYGGDWPVLLLAASYARWVDTVDEMIATSGMGEAAQHRLWRENAKRIYRI